MRIGVICGGPSAERGISLNSARSFMDHLSPLGFQIVPFYCDTNQRLYRLLPGQLYSNTPSDFDFKLQTTAEPLDDAAFLAACRSVDLIFPAIHGRYGEDGVLQEWLESHDIPFVGSGSETCGLMFDKARASAHLARHGFASLPHCVVHQGDAEDVTLDALARFFRDHHLTRVVIKPTAGGSSLGVSMADTPQEALAKIWALFAEKRDVAALIEPYCDGQEFTILVLENDAGDPVALIPTEIELSDESDTIFTFRHKYLPTCRVAYHCPPRFDDVTVTSIQKAAEILFTFFGMRDFARLDGWLMKDGRVLFSDFNPISGMEQNSFLFIQASRIGLSHGAILRHIVMNAARRHGIPAEPPRTVPKKNPRDVFVLCGGVTAERQVSLMSGTNVWLKLRHAPSLRPTPYLLGPNDVVWRLPYSYTLNHTVEEILAHCTESDTIASRTAQLAPTVQARLRLNKDDLLPDEQPERMTLDAFCARAAAADAFVFLGLHGGMGEDGTIQAKLEQAGIPFNGSRSAASRLCMDKDETGRVIRALNDPALTSTDKVPLSLPARDVTFAETTALWDAAATHLGTQDLLIKPNKDGCSAGVIRLKNAKDLFAYFQALFEGLVILPPYHLSAQPAALELPVGCGSFLIEPFIATDPIAIDGAALTHTPVTGWVELTVGVLERNGDYHALAPSITVAEQSILSLEEKFQGGTGVNLTPPPPSIITAAQTDLIRQQIEKAARALGIAGYARLDIFFNVKTDQTLLIEANTLPGLTASTVIYHQALAEDPPLHPRAFLETIIHYGQMGSSAESADPSAYERRACQGP